MTTTADGVLANFAFGGWKRKAVENHHLVQLYEMSSSSSSSNNTKREFKPKLFKRQTKTLILLSFIHSFIQVLILQHGHVASNLTVAFDDSNIVLSNLEPRHVYEVQVAAFNGEGLGPFSQPLEVRPEPSLALTAGAMAAEDLNDSSSDSSSSLLWIIPVVIALIILGLLFFSAVILVRRSKNHHQQSHHFSSGNPLFSLGRKSNKNSSSHFQAAERKDFQLIPTSATSGTGTRRKKMTSSSSAILFSSSSQGIHQNLSSTLSEDIAEEGEEDSSCIDRSTHSITGGFLRRKGGVNKEDDPLEIEAEDAMRRRLLNLSPYATTHLVQGNNPKRRNFNHNPQVRLKKEMSILSRCPESRLSSFIFEKLIQLILTYNTIVQQWVLNWPR